MEEFTGNQTEIKQRFMAVLVKRKQKPNERPMTFFKDLLFLTKDLKDDKLREELILQAFTSGLNLEYEQLFEKLVNTDQLTARKAMELITSCQKEEDDQQRLIIQATFHGFVQILITIHFVIVGLYRYNKGEEEYFEDEEDPKLWSPMMHTYSYLACVFHFWAAMSFLQALNKQDPFKALQRMGRWKVVQVLAGMGKICSMTLDKSAAYAGGEMLHVAVWTLYSINLLFSLDCGRQYLSYLRNAVASFNSNKSR